MHSQWRSLVRNVKSYLNSHQSDLLGQCKLKRVFKSIFFNLPKQYSIQLQVAFSYLPAHCVFKRALVFLNATTFQKPRNKSRLYSPNRKLPSLECSKICKFLRANVTPHNTSENSHSPLHGHNASTDTMQAH